MNSRAPESWRLYCYVGPAEIQARARLQPAGFAVTSLAELIGWLDRSGQQPGPGGLIGLTFVIDSHGTLRLADRRSEHVACAGGESVFAAGELFLAREEVSPGPLWRVAEVSNLSTGYCPEPTCWPALAATLEALGLPHPGHFTLSVLFRRCPNCGQRNVVREDWFVCADCGADLPAEWNFSGGPGNSGSGEG